MEIGLSESNGVLWKWLGCVRWQGGMRMACHSETKLVSGNYLSGDVYPMKSDVYLIVGICIFLHR